MCDIPLRELVVAHGARGDIKDKQGNTSAGILAKKRDTDLQWLAEQLRQRK